MAVPSWTTSEEERLKSFKYWPYKKGPCRPEKMAEAGFYSIGSKSEPDLAKCYVCLKELDGWEKDDCPWSEHKKHAAACPYVILNKNPDQLTVKDILTLECEKQKKMVTLYHESKIKMISEMQNAVKAERDKKIGKENCKRKISRVPSKRTSKKE